MLSLSYRLIPLGIWIFLILPKIRDLDNWVTSSQEFLGSFVISSELVVVTTLDVSSMVLIEVIQLVVDINWTLDILGHFWERQIDFAGITSVSIFFFKKFTTIFYVIISNNRFDDLIAHDI